MHEIHFFFIASVLFFNEMAFNEIALVFIITSIILHETRIQIIFTSNFHDLPAANRILPANQSNTLSA